MLKVRNLVARYGDFQALFGVDFDAEEGRIAALIGANGAGKSTFLRSIAGLMPSKGGEIRFHDDDIGALAADEVVRRGISMVPEGRRLFRSLTVEENLKSRRVCRTKRAMDAGNGVRVVPGPEGAALEPGDRALRRPAANGRHRSGPDVEPGPAALRRTVVRSLARWSSRTSTPSFPKSAARACRSSWWSRTSTWRSGRPTKSIASCTVG